MHYQEYSHLIKCKQIPNLLETETAYPTSAQVFWWGPVLLIFLVFLCCPIIFLYVLNSVLRFPHKNDVQFVFASDSLQVGSCLIYVMCVCDVRFVFASGSLQADHVLFTLCVFACIQWCSTHIELCFCFVFSFSCVPYVARFSGLSILHCPIGIL